MYSNNNQSDRQHACATPLCASADVEALLSLRLELLSRKITPSWSNSFSGISDFDCTALAAKGIECDDQNSTVVKL
jgi:hypothetical protein